MVSAFFHGNGDNDRLNSDEGVAGEDTNHSSSSEAQTEGVAKKLRSLLLPVGAAIILVLTGKHIKNETGSIMKEHQGTQVTTKFYDALQHDVGRRGVNYFLLNSQGEPITEGFHSFAVRNGEIFGIRREGGEPKAFPTGKYVSPHSTEKPTDQVPTSSLEHLQEVPLEGPQVGYNGSF